MMTNKLPTPIVHSNGTGQESLTKQCADVYRALDAALDAMAKARPHGRDYYPVPGSYEVARDAHNELYNQVCKVKDEYAVLGWEIQKVGE